MNEGKRIKIYEPSERDYFEQYPDLLNQEAFSGLTQQEAKFCWYFAYRFSPFRDEVNIHRKITACFELSFGKDKRLEPLLDQYKQQAWPEKLNDAMDFFRRINPDVRTAALDMCKKIFEQYKSIVNSADEKITNKKMDISEQKNYVALTVDINKAIPDLVKTIEEGFGIKKVEHGQDETLYLRAMTTNQKV